MMMAHSENIRWRDEFCLPSIDCMDAAKLINTTQTE
uniref:Uncharacterized protein n=1 Tax=Brassica oleracea TaxID=3712 RepID=A0A3P6BRT1_BRAOL|nr:unnamed protein product [Brassica oleracea]